MTQRRDEILNFISNETKEMTAKEIAEKLNLDRANVSRYLNELVKTGRVTKFGTRPIFYQYVKESVHQNLATMSFENLVGVNSSLKVAIQQGKAAILYPPHGLHTIIFGNTGTGKSLFAECMYQFALDSETLDKKAPFVSFNCADYAQNPQLLFAHIFGVKKGAYTGATENQEGLVAQANGGILFLDEIHRLPPEGQEMLFTFIDKGIYRPLGETKSVREATVQIIGATTESSESFLTTFNRRIPMAVHLPSIDERKLDERLEIVSLFIKQEANRLHQKIKIQKEAILAFMLYHAEGNIGQVKRDLKLVCAKAFLHYRTHQEDFLVIKKEDLPIQVQKGLLRIKEVPDQLKSFVDNKSQLLTFAPGGKDVVWLQDPANDMDVYNNIEKKVEEFSKKYSDIDLEELISKDMDQYFETYLQELSQSKVHQELIPKRLWQLTNRLYDKAQQSLERTFSQKSRFAFALHLQGTLDRLQDNQVMIHPDLNDVRKKFLKEFQVAIDLSSMIEEEYDLEIPFDEIGFIAMFLTIDLGEHLPVKETNVKVIVLMHGTSTASSMLLTAQELLGTKEGLAMDMSLTRDVQEIYEELKNHIQKNRLQFTNGLLLLTDMGSLNTFSNMIYEETGIQTKGIAMSSTLIVLEALRMATVGRSLEDIYQNIQLSFESSLREQFKQEVLPTNKKKAIVVACFTGEGVAKRLYQRIHPVIDNRKVEVIQMQLIEKTAFKRHIDGLLNDYHVIAICGTVDIGYQNIPFFSALDLFNNEQLEIIKRLSNEELPIDKIIQSLENTLKNVPVVSQFIFQIQKALQQVQSDLHVILEPSAEVGIIMHIAVLFDTLIKGEISREFKDLRGFQKKYRMEMDMVRTNFLLIEKKYQVLLPEEEVAFLTKMFLENQIPKANELHTTYSV